VTAAAVPTQREVEERARKSKGTSEDVIYRMVSDALSSRHLGGGVLLDVGCGVGRLRQYVSGQFGRYLGADVVRYEDLPPDVDFCLVNLDAQRVELPDNAADVVAAVETIEHLENPRGFMRELVRLVSPGGWVVVSTPNQLSLLSKLTLVLKNQFNSFQDGCYPAHITALLEVDLRRMAAECGLVDVTVGYSIQGRVPGTPWHYPRWLSRQFPRALSDNVMLVARKGV
jgi:2-polyprenyl-3-methyl-5-hydroxy-6-metoxy-1,4-benzoquinol methylase